jgi:hypothetical protein
MIPFEWEIFPCIQLDYVFSPSKIPIPVSNPLVDEHIIMLLSNWIALVIMQGLDWLMEKFK